jgi:hypothetical protein
METLLTSQVPGTHSLTGKSVLYGVTKSNWGGAQAYVAMMANGARNAGAKVTVGFLKSSVKTASPLFPLKP